MKITRFATLRAKPISWVTTIMVMPSCASSTMTSSTSLIISGSSAEVGSSNSMQIGSMDRARAIATRCCWPPESWPGNLCACCEADAVEQRHAARVGLVPAAAEHLDLGDRQVLGDGHVREQLEVLEHHADVRTQLRQVGLRVADGGAVDEDVALLEGFEAVHAFDQRGFAGAGRAADDDDLALFDLVRAVGQHLGRRTIC
jgi:hypothetical protein